MRGTTQAFPVCKSHCENEIQLCRTMGSGFGHISQIQQECRNAPWADEVGPSAHCTSSWGRRRRAAASPAVQLLAPLAAAALLAPLTGRR